MRPNAYEIQSVMLALHFARKQETKTPTATQKLRAAVKASVRGMEAN